MATKITKPVTINAAGKDVVFNGVDFTVEGIVTIVDAASVTFENCRVYGMALPSNSSKGFVNIAGDIPTKLIVRRCFFGSNVGIYNLLNLAAKLQTGSMVSENYFKADCCSHNAFSLYHAEEGAVIELCDNYFEKSDGTIRIGVKEEPTCTFNIHNNVIAAPAGVPEYEGLVLVQPSFTNTTSFANMTINMNNNTFAAEQKIYCYYGSKDLVLTKENMPKVYINGRLIENVPVIAG